jgi:hypothetical protein
LDSVLTGQWDQLLQAESLPAHCAIMSVGVVVSSGSILQTVFSQFRIVERVHVEFLFGNAILGVEI